jgi:hypothetical protein
VPRDKEKGIAIFEMNEPAMPTRQSCPAISWFAGYSGAPIR